MEVLRNESGFAFCNKNILHKDLSLDILRYGWQIMHKSSINGQSKSQWTNNKFHILYCHCQNGYSVKVI